MPGTFEVLGDAGYAELEFGGDYDGRTPTEARGLAESYGLKVASNHFGPRTLIQNTWYDPGERARFFEEAHALGLEAIGTGHSYIAPRTVDGYKEMAAAFNVWGEDAVRNGFRYFFFHNHDVEFTIVNGRPLYDILLEETDPRYVKFELDLGWIEVAGQTAYEYLRRDPGRFPLFHVKDIRWDPNGPRAAARARPTPAGPFFFADLGKGVVDWPKIFSALRNPRRPPLLRRARRRRRRRDARRHLAAAAQPRGLGEHRLDRPQVPRQPGDPQASALVSSQPSGRRRPATRSAYGDTEGLPVRGRRITPAPVTGLRRRMSGVRG